MEKVTHYSLRTISLSVYPAQESGQGFDRIILDLMVSGAWGAKKP
jgi:hypothetical protein